MKNVIKNLQKPQKYQTSKTKKKKEKKKKETAPTSKPTLSKKPHKLDTIMLE